MKKVVLPLILLMILFSSVERVYSKAFLVGVERFEYKPFHWVERDVYVGFNRELLDTFARSRGYTFGYRILPVKRLFLQFLRQEVDFKYPDHPLWSGRLKQGKTIYYSKGVIDFIEGVLVKPVNLNKGLRQLKGLGTVLGFTAWDYVKMVEDKKIEIIENKNFLGLLKMTIKGRLDGAYTNIAVGKYALKHSLQQTNALVFNPSLPHSKGTYHLSSLTQPTVILEFNRFLKRHHLQVEALKRKYKILEVAAE